MSWIIKERRQAIYIRDGYRCLYCLRDLCPGRCDPDDITLDHLKPRSKGGLNHNSNLVTCCRSCNSSRQATRWTIFAQDDETRRRIRNQRRRVVNISLGYAFLYGSDNDLEGNDSI